MLCQAATHATREARFEDPDGVGGLHGAEARGLAAARAMAASIGTVERASSAPSPAARETLSALGLEGPVEALLRGRNVGAWGGRTPEEIARGGDGALLAAFASDPGFAPPGGEAMEAVSARAAAMLAAWAEEPGGTGLAVTHAEVVRAMVAAVLGVPVASCLALDLGPLARVVLTRSDRWRLRALIPARDG